GFSFFPGKARGIFGLEYIYVSPFLIDYTPLDMVSWLSVSLHITRVLQLLGSISFLGFQIATYSLSQPYTDTTLTPNTPYFVWFLLGGLTIPINCTIVYLGIRHGTNTTERKLDAALCIVWIVFMSVIIHLDGSFQHTSAAQPGLRN